MDICPITKDYCNLNPSGEMVYGCLGCRHFQAMEGLVLSLRSFRTEDLEALESGHIEVMGKKRKSKRGVSSAY